MAATAATGADLKTQALLEAGADPLARNADGHTAFDLAAASLCSRAENYEAAFRELYAGLAKLRLAPQRGATAKTAIGSIAAVCQEYLSGFAERIPLAPYSTAQQLRDEQIRAMSLIAAYRVVASRKGPAAATR